MQRIEIRIRGHIRRDWSDWLADITSTPTLEGDTVLTGSIPDQSALYGLLNRLSDLGLQLVSVSAISPIRELEDEEVSSGQYESTIEDSPITAPE